jgi:hypothetical protein
VRIVKQKIPLFIKDKVAGEFFLQQLSFIEKTLGEISQRKQP